MCDPGPPSSVPPGVCRADRLNALCPSGSPQVPPRTPPAAPLPAAERPLCSCAGHAARAPFAGPLVGVTHDRRQRDRAAATSPHRASILNHCSSCGSPSTPSARLPRRAAPLTDRRHSSIYPARLPLWPHCKHHLSSLRWARLCSRHTTAACTRRRLAQSVRAAVGRPWTSDAFWGVAVTQSSGQLASAVVLKAVSLLHIPFTKLQLREVASKIVRGLARNEHERDWHHEGRYHRYDRAGGSGCRRWVLKGQSWGVQGSRARSAPHQGCQ